MVALILFILFGLLFGYFATLNTALVSIYLGPMPIAGIPMYLLILTSFGVGVVFASIFYYLRSIFSRVTLRKLEQQLSDVEKEKAELTKKLHKMELENARLKGKNGEAPEDEESI